MKIIQFLAVAIGVQSLSIPKAAVQQRSSGGITGKVFPEWSFVIELTSFTQSMAMEAAILAVNSG